MMATVGINPVPAALTDQQLDSICVLFPAISWSTKDTDQSIAEIKIFNAKRDSFCAEFEKRQ